MLALLLRIRKEMGKNMHELQLIPGMKDALPEIRNLNCRLGILTSNSKNNVHAFLKANCLSGIIDFVYSGRSLLGKNKVMLQLLAHENISKEDVIYVGDEARDIEASKKAGIQVVAVTWGLQHRETLSALQPDMIADTPGELVGCIKKMIL